MNKNILLELSEDQKKAIKEEAKKRGLKMNKMIRLILEQNVPDFIETVKWEKTPNN